MISEIFIHSIPSSSSHHDVGSSFHTPTYIEPSVAKLNMTGLTCTPCRSSAARAAQHEVLAEEHTPDSASHAGIVNADLPVNPYHVLQVRRDATPAEIRQSYRRLALWHHPGRTHADMAERQRRLQVFEILAACYETLMFPGSRRGFDAYLREREAAKLTSGLPVGGMFVGGKRIFGADSPERSVLPSDDGFDEGDRIPNLSAASSDSSSSEEPEDHMVIMPCTPPASVASDQNSKRSRQPRSLVDVSSSGSGSDEEAEVHFTEAETKRLFGGPLSHLYRVRNFEPFSDPFVVFEEVFGSKVFQISADEIGRLKEWMPLRSTRAGGWHGASETSPDGKTTIFTTSRILHDRRLVRTETVTVDPVTGTTRSFVTVTAEDLEPEGDDEMPTSTCLLCYTATSTPTYDDPTDSPPPPGSNSSVCADFSMFYNQLVDDIAWGSEDISRNWSGMFGCGEAKSP